MATRRVTARTLSDQAQVNERTPATCTLATREALLDEFTGDVTRICEKHCYDGPRAEELSARITRFLADLQVD